MRRGTRGKLLRRRLFAWALLILGIALATAVAGGRAQPLGAGQAAADDPVRPNVLVIETDDQTVESMRVMANVNSLIGAQGARFTNSFVNLSLCCPSRSTFLTGKYAHNHGVFSNRWPTGGFRRFQQLHGNNNLAVWLQNAGYYTAMIGKYLNEYQNQPLVPPGWSEWQAVAPNWLTVYNYTVNDNGTLVTYGQDPSDFKQDVLTERAVDFVDGRALETQPFFLWLNYTAPHTREAPNPNPNPPSDCAGAAKPPPRYANAFDSEPLPRPSSFNEPGVADKPAEIRALPRLTASEITNLERKYRCELESLLAVDDGVKKLIDALQASGQLDNTLVIYTSDNGYLHGQHRIGDDKLHIYEESIRVPLLMRGPGVPPGVNIAPLVINADLAPTIVDAANATAGLHMDGRSLLPVVSNPGIIKNRQLLIEEPVDEADGKPGFEGIRTQRYAYAEYHTGERELYDLRDDPFELQSRHDAPAYGPVRSELANRLHALQTCSGSSCRVYKPDPAPLP
jgi:N-acetylglucosamine-6-sulfatase